MEKITKNYEAPVSECNALQNWQPLCSSFGISPVEEQNDPFEWE